MVAEIGRDIADAELALLIGYVAKIFSQMYRLDMSSVQQCRFQCAVAAMPLRVMKIEYGAAEVRDRVRVAVPEREGLSIASDCFVEPTLICQRVTEVGECCGVIRLEGERLLIAGDGLVDPTSILQHDPEVAQNFGSIRLQRQRLLVARDGCVGLSQGFKGEPEVGESLRNIGIK